MLSTGKLCGHQITYPIENYIYRLLFYEYKIATISLLQTLQDKEKVFLGKVNQGCQNPEFATYFHIRLESNIECES